MTIVKSAQRPDPMGRIFLSAGAAWVVVLVIVFASVEDVAARKIIALLAFLAIVVVIAGLARRRPREFRCPDCGGEVSGALPTEGRGGEPVLCKCTACDVLWHVGYEPGPMGH